MRSCFDMISSLYFDYLRAMRSQRILNEFSVSLVYDRACSIVNKIE